MNNEEKNFKALSHKVIGGAIEVHRALGPGLLKYTYQRCLGRGLELNKIAHLRETPLPIEYKKIRLDLDCGSNGTKEEQEI